MDRGVDMEESAAAAKSLQSCPTLCDPIDGSPPGSAIPGILQARTLEWVAISFSNAWKWKVKVKLFSCVRLLATPWTSAYQAPLSIGFSYGVGCHCLLCGREWCYTNNHFFLFFPNKISNSPPAPLPNPPISISRIYLVAYLVTIFPQLSLELSLLCNSFLANGMWGVLYVFENHWIFSIHSAFHGFEIASYWTFPGPKRRVTYWWW